MCVCVETKTQMMSGEVFSVSSVKAFLQEPEQNPNPKTDTNPNVKKRRNLPGTPGIQFFFFSMFKEQS